MLKKLSQKKGNIKSFDLIDNINIQTITRNVFENYFDIDGKLELPSCINCEEKSCYKYNENEINIKIFDSLPYNNDLRVCPVNAIEIDENYNISINENCISCGLCVQRCPIGGLYLDKENNFKATKYDVNTNIFCENNEKLVSSSKIKDKIKTEHYSEIIINENYLDAFYSKIDKKNTTILDFELILSRNILINLKIPNKVTAKGNNDSRFDLIGLLEDKYLLAEIDYKNNDNLSLIRKTLENISLLENKFQIKKDDKILPVIIINDLPNKRSDMYELLNDIYNVLNIKIYTLPLHYLLICSLINKRLTFKDITQFYINKNNVDFIDPIVNTIENIIEIDEYFKIQKKYKPLK